MSVTDTRQLQRPAASRDFPWALTAAHALVRTLIVLNLALGAGILALFVTSLVAREVLFEALKVGLATPRMIDGMRLIMVIGIGATPLTHILLTRLLAIVETVRRGDPFVADNAARLQTMAWALLGLEVLHLVVGAVAAAASSPSQPIDLDWNFSVRGWLAVLLLFVLARVFDHGTRLRNDLDGTV
jgi:hypothetical protein